MVLAVRDIADANAKREKEATIKKLHDVVSRTSTQSQDIDSETSRIYEDRREEVAKSMHVSVNLKADRFFSMLEGGILYPTVPSQKCDRAYREKVEKAFHNGDGESPVYGALNISSTRGGAPLFSAYLWLELDTEAIRHRTTFTGRDSVTIARPHFKDVTEQQARDSLMSETYDWDTVVEYYLNRFWSEQDATSTNYIEAQIWNPVQISDVQAIHVHEGFKAEFVDGLEKCDAEYNVLYAKQRIVIFN
jgi:hypothetical protein